MAEKPNARKDPFEAEGFLKGISHVESRGGKYMWNNNSTATGLYGQLYSEMDNNFLNTNGINSREDFAADTAIQSAYMRQVISGNMRDTPRKTNLYKDARDLTEEYMPQLGDKWNYRYDEIAALSHFLGRGGTRKYLGHHIRDNNPAGYKIPANNKTPVEYLELYNEGRNNYNQSIQEVDTTLPGRESFNIQDMKQKKYGGKLTKMKKGGDPKVSKDYWGITTNGGTFNYNDTGIYEFFPAALSKRKDASGRRNLMSPNMLRRHGENKKELALLKKKRGNVLKYNELNKKGNEILAEYNSIPQMGGEPAQVDGITYTNGGQLPQKSAGGVISSTAQGAMGGMALGPWGAVAGAAVGLGMGLIGHSQEQKALVDEDAAIAQSERDQYKIGRTQQLFTEANQNSNFENPVMREYGGFIDYNKGQSHEGPNKGIPVDAQGNPGVTEDTAALVEKGEITVMMPDGKPYVFPKKMAAEVKREMNRYKIRLGKDLDGDDKLSRAGYDSAMTALKDKNEATKPSEPEYAGDVAMAEYGGDDFFDGATVYAERPMQMEPWMSEPFNSNNKYGNQLSSIANQGISYPNQYPTAGSNSQGTSTPATWTESEGWQQLPMWGPDMDGQQPQQPWMTGKLGPVTGTPGRASMGVQRKPSERSSIAPLQNNISSFTGISPGQRLGMTPYGQYADNNTTNTPTTQSVIQPELAGAYPTTATTNQTPMDTASAYLQGAVDVGANTDYSLQGTGNFVASNTTTSQSPDVYNPATGQMIASGISGAVGAAANLGLAFGRRKPTMMNAPQISAQTIDLGEQRLANRSRAGLAKAESRNLARKVGATKSQDIATSALAGAAIERNLGEQNAAITMQEKQYNAQARQQAAGYNAQSKSQANQFNAMTQNRFNQDTNQYIGAAASNLTGAGADMNRAQQGANYLSMVGARSGYQQVRDPKTGKIVLAPIPGFYDKYNS